VQAQQLDRDYLRINAPVLDVADLLARALGEAAGGVEGGPSRWTVNQKSI
jgi:hypothetical protein